MSLLRSICIAAAILASAPLLLAQSSGDLDLSFETGSKVNGMVHAVVPAGNGKVYIGGAFTTVRGAIRNHISRLNADGTVDTSFNPGSGASSVIYSLALQTDGKVLIGGDFSSYNGTVCNGIARLNANGSLDTGFDPGSGVNAGVRSIVLQGDGKVLIGGDFTTYNGTERDGIARLNADGGLDTSFTSSNGANASVRSIALQTDGKVLIGGNFNTYNSTARNRIARLNANGSLDTGFDPGSGANTDVVSIALLADGKVLIGGSFTSYNGTARSGIARLNTNGGLDTGSNLGSGASNEVNSIALQADGKLLIGGGNRVERLYADGSLDLSFNPGSFGTNTEISSVAAQADGKVLIGGRFTSYNGTARDGIARLNANGSLDTGFNPGSGANNEVHSIALQVDGKSIIGGSFTSYNGTGRNRIARLNADGSLDTSFDPGIGVDGPVLSIALQADGKVLIRGDFTSYNGTERNCIARLNVDGSLDTNFDPGSGANDKIHTLSLQDDGKVLIGGNFTIYNGTARTRIARLNPNGSLDLSFNPSSGLNAAIYSAASQADGKVLIGGRFTSYNGRNRIARLNANGSLDTGFNPGSGANNEVNSIALLADGKLLIGGNFSSFNDSSRHGIARLNTDGSLDINFDPGSGVDGSVLSIALQADGNVFIGGTIRSYNGTICNGIARLNANGSLDTGFDPGSGTNNDVFSIALQADGKVLICGAFTSYNGIARSNLAQVFNGSASQYLAATSPNRIEWLRSDATPEIEQVTFESSTNGLDWIPLGSASRISGGWELIGLSLPASGQIRARGRANHASIIEQVRAIVTVPLVTTAAITDITFITASCGGEVTATGLTDVTERGIVFGTVPNPTLTGGTKVVSGSGTGSFTAKLTELTANTIYYVRAFATNSVGTAYGSTISLTTRAPYSLGDTNTMAAWGSNASGRLGNNSTTSSSVPVLVTQSGALSSKTVNFISAGAEHCLVLYSDGTMAAWGNNYYGQLGNNSTTESLIPVMVSESGVLSEKTVVAIAAGFQHSLALCSDGTIAAWGNNSSGELGNNSTIASSVPVLVTQSGALSNKTVVAISAGFAFSLALCSDGTVAAWGNNSSGELGNNSLSPSTVPVLVTQSGALSGKTVVEISAGLNHSLVLCSDGTVAAWGRSNGSSIPVLVSQSGTLYGKTVVKISAGGFHSLALCSDGTVAAWGKNSSGQLGNNSTTESRIPVMVSESGVLSEKTVVAIAAGYDHNIVLCSDGTVAAWGSNSAGQLGNNSTIASSVPVIATQSGALSDKTVMEISAGFTYSIVAASLQFYTTLSSLHLSDGSLSPNFNPYTISYEASVPSSTSSITVTPAALDSLASVTVNGATVASGEASNPIPLAVGNNTITVVVMAQDGVTTSTYTVSVTRAPSSIATLNGLVLSAGSISPTFVSNTTAYTLTVANTVTSTTVTPTVTNSAATVKVNGATVASGTATTSIPIAVGTNTITVLVTAQDGTTQKTYTVTVTRAVSSVATLNGLALSSGSLNPAFTSNTAAYTLAVANSVTSTTVNATVTNSAATVNVNGATVASGTASSPIALAVGSNTISVLVTAQDGTTQKTYTVTVTRAASNVATLSGLVISAGSLSPTFASGTTAYTLAAANNVTSTTVIPTVTDTSATVKVNGVTVASGTTSASIPLAVGANTISVEVTAQNGTTKQTYTVTIARLPSSVATLNSLALSAGSLSPIFAPGTTTYTLSVANTVTTTTVAPTLTNAAATVKVNGVTVALGSASTSIPLAVGSNTIKVEVTAQNGITKHTYTITVIRAASSDAWLKKLTVKGGSLSPKFAKKKLAYKTAVSTSQKTIQIQATSAHPKAKIKIAGKKAGSGIMSKPIALKAKKTTITVVVTAENGSKKTYEITATRP
jgi:uncharacterized delta-60 repeat protein